MCDRVLVIDHGRLIADDTPANLSKNVSGNLDVTVRVQGDREKTGEILGKLPNTQSVEYMGEKENDAHDFKVVPCDNMDIRCDVSAALVNGGVKLIGLRFAEHTLEDIFLDLIAKEEAK